MYDEGPVYLWRREARPGGGQGHPQLPLPPPAQHYSHRDKHFYCYLLINSRDFN